jgi:hypothetical protein
VANQYYKEFNQARAQQLQHCEELLQKVKAVLGVESDQALLETVEALKNTVKVVSAISPLLQKAAEKLECKPQELLTGVDRILDKCARSNL